MSTCIVILISSSLKLYSMTLFYVVEFKFLLNSCRFLLVLPERDDEGRKIFVFKAGVLYSQLYQSVAYFGGWAFIHSRIHSRIYIAPLQGNYSEVLPTPA